MVCIHRHAQKLILCFSILATLANSSQCFGQSPVGGGGAPPVSGPPVIGMLSLSSYVNLTPGTAYDIGQVCTMWGSAYCEVSDTAGSNYEFILTGQMYGIAVDPIAGKEFVVPLNHAGANDSLSTNVPHLGPGYEDILERISINSLATTTAFDFYRGEGSIHARSYSAVTGVYGTSILVDIGTVEFTPNSP